jgi:hypothetical protein
MSEPVDRVLAKNGEAEPAPSTGRRTRGRVALELVAMRGKDVLGVRHLVDGGTAWIGNVSESLARLSMREFGGQPIMIGEVRAGTYALHVPPRARARAHGWDGIPRLMIGPHRIELREGERAVLVLGAVQIRAQVVPFEVSTAGSRMPLRVAAWAAAIGLVYVGALALASALGPSTPPRLTTGAVQRIHQRFLPEKAQPPRRSLP